MNSTLTDPRIDQLQRLPLPGAVEVRLSPDFGGDPFKDACGEYRQQGRLEGNRQLLTRQRFTPPTSPKVNFGEDVFVMVLGLVRECRPSIQLDAVVALYRDGLISQSKASKMAGVSRQQFIGELSKRRVSPFQATAAELAEEESL